jgi:hypothetical protein
MKFFGIYTLQSPLDEIWPLIQDSASLVRLIPCSEQPEQTNLTEYRGQYRIRSQPWCCSARPAYQTLASGIRVVLSHVDNPLPLHNLATLEDLAHQIGKLAA